MADRTWTGRLLLKGEDRGISKSAQKVETAVGGVASKLKQFGALAAVAGGVALFAGSVNKIRQFEKSISDLSAITGAAGADLDKLTEASKRIGQTTTLTASQAAEAFKLMASAKPDLLSNLDALEATTAASVTLAEAAGLELPAATSALGESLNQFGAGAEEANRFINVLAAGAKFGSSEIEQTAEALKNAGTVANLAGLTFEETNASIQAMAAAGIKGSDAGTKLRSVLIKLQTQTNDGFNPAVVGMEKALFNLGEANLSVTEKVAIFGERSVATADILISQQETYNRVNEAVTGTSEAFDQAAKRTDNLDGDIKRLSSAFEAFQLNLANGGLPVFREIIQSITDIFNAVAALTASDGINKADDQFKVFDATLKTLFVTGSIIKNFFDSLFDSLVFIGRSIVDALSGNFDLIDDHFAEFQGKVEGNGRDIAEAAFRSFQPEAARQLDEAADALAPIVRENQQKLEDIKTDVALTAGQERTLAELEAEAEAQEKKEMAFETKLERFRLANQTELEALIENHELKLAEIALLEENTIFLEGEANAKRLAAQEEFEKKRRAISIKGATKLEKFDSLTATNKTKFALSEATKLTAGVAQNSKTMFKINKVAAIANAVINTGQAITRTMADYPYPLNIAFAALTAAAGFAQIQSIRSTQFSGGGSGTTPSAAGGSPVVNNNPVSGGGGATLDGLLEGQATGPATQVTINIDGLPDAGPVPAEMVRDLISGINEQLGDGVTLDAGPGGGTGG